MVLEFDNCKLNYIKTCRASDFFLAYPEQIIGNFSKNSILILNFSFLIFRHNEKLYSYALFTNDLIAYKSCDIFEFTGTVKSNEMPIEIHAEESLLHRIDGPAFVENMTEYHCYKGEYFEPLYFWPYCKDNPYSNILFSKIFGSNE